MSGLLLPTSVDPTDLAAQVERMRQSLVEIQEGVNKLVHFAALTAATMEELVNHLIPDEED